MGVLAVCNTYLVDVMQDRSAEVIATNKYAIALPSHTPFVCYLICLFASCLRYIASAAASAAVLPIIQAINIAPTNGIATVFSLIGFGLICATIKYGKAWREGANTSSEASEL